MISGSANTVGATLGLLGAGTALVGAAPILLGVGAITTGGALAYDLLTDTSPVQNTNQAIEDWASEPDGFVESTISMGQDLVEKGVNPTIATAEAVDQVAKEQIAGAILNPINNAINGISEFVSQIFG